MDTRFKPTRINGNHSYSGIKLKEVEYKKIDGNSDVEKFIFQVCEFSDTGKVLNSVLLKEYNKWKLSVNKEISENDMKDIKEYLNKCEYTLKSTVWTNAGSNEGYYGLRIKTNDEQPIRIISSTGKKVYKRESKTGELLSTWDTIANAAISENVSKAKMSRLVKSKSVVNDDYYYSNS